MTRIVTEHGDEIRTRTEVAYEICGLLFEDLGQVLEILALTHVSTEGDLVKPTTPLASR